MFRKKDITASTEVSRLKVELESVRKSWKEEAALRRGKENVLKEIADDPFWGQMDVMKVSLCLDAGFGEVSLMRRQ